MATTVQFTQDMVETAFPIHLEKRIPTLDRPVVIECAYPGWQMGGNRYPAVPRTVDQQVRELVDSVRAGAAIIHVHPRNPDTGFAEINSKLQAQIQDLVCKEVGDVVTLSHTWTADENHEIDYITHTRELIELGEGNRHCQGSVVLPSGRIGLYGQRFTVRGTATGIKWLEENDVMPVFQLYDTYAVWGIRHDYIDKQVTKKKAHIYNLHLGKHHSHTIHRDPWSHMQLITNYNMVRETVSEESVIGVYPGGRNWLPILVQGLLLGAPLVRVGIEDCYWLYPHRDDIIAKNSEMVTLCKGIAESLGRRVITDFDEAREYLGLTLTSPRLGKKK